MHYLEVYAAHYSNYALRKGSTLDGAGHCANRTGLRICGAQFGEYLARHPGSQPRSVLVKLFIKSINFVV